MKPVHIPILYFFCPVLYGPRPPAQIHSSLSAKDTELAAEVKALRDALLQTQRADKLAAAREIETLKHNRRRQ